jgi:Cys-tRNA(Pro)/Cys-tRNA(Cys) deacylase
MKPTNVTRLLDQRKIPYTDHQLPPEKLGALEVAQYLGVPPEEVYKTIVVKRQPQGKPILALVPGNHEVNLKALAKAIGEKKVQLPTQREAEQLTGLQAGGISPLALLNRGFQVILDISAKNHHKIYISGGQRGLDIQLPVSDLITLTSARVAEISHMASAENTGDKI